MLQDYIWKACTAPEAYSKHAYGAVCILDMVLEHIWLRKFFQIMNSRGQNLTKAMSSSPLEGIAP